MSTSPEAPARGTDASTRSERFKNCWSCRILSGGGLILSGAFVFNAARRMMKRGGSTTVGTVAQITFAACVVSFGIVVITDPVGHMPKKM